LQALCDVANPEAKLLWDEERLSTAHIRKIGSFWKPILKLLQRNVSVRGTVKEFHPTSLLVIEVDLGSQY
jgi:hypothetical protein